jgi:hypothetical protein
LLTSLERGVSYFPPAAAFTHLTAAELRGWWLPQKIPHPVFAALCEGDPCPHRAGLYASRHPHRVPSELVSGVRLTTPAETLLAAARDLGVLDLVLMGDSALRLGTARSMILWRQRLSVAAARPCCVRSSGCWISGVSQRGNRSCGCYIEQRTFPSNRSMRSSTSGGGLSARGDLWIVGTNRLHEFDGGKHREPEVQGRDLTRDRLLIEADCQRFGFTKAQLLNDGASINASTDKLLGRSWYPRRLRRWNALIADSMFGRPGRARALRNWRTS